METLKSPEQQIRKIQVGTYKGYKVYTWPLVPKEAVANMSPDSENRPVDIRIRPDAYEILKARPDYLEKIYAHELQHHTTKEGAEHGGEDDILVLEFLRDNGYDFGDFVF